MLRRPRRYPLRLRALLVEGRKGIRRGRRMTAALDRYSDAIWLTVAATSSAISCSKRRPLRDRSTAATGCTALSGQAPLTRQEYPLNPCKGQKWRGKQGRRPQPKYSF